MTCLCQGGQLISKALGGVVSKSPLKEIGWGEVTVADSDIARQWFGDSTQFDSFHWHGETFSVKNLRSQRLQKPQQGRALMWFEIAKDIQQTTLIRQHPIGTGFLSAVCRGKVFCAAPGRQPFHTHSQQQCQTVQIVDR